MVSPLFEPLKLRDLTLDNRIVISPMCQYSATGGQPGTWHLIHLGHLALSGAALLFIEATAVTPEGRITPGDLGLYSDKTEAALAGLLTAIRAESRIAIGMQLAHAGRKASTAVPWDGGEQLTYEQGGWDCVAPSAVPMNDGERPPIALDDAGLAAVREAFTQAAVRAARLGIDAIELHAAHGYLLHEFLSPLSNRRDDAYGGGITGRMRFPLEVFDAIRAVFPAGKPVGVRVSATDWVPGGLDVDETLIVAQAFKEHGCDFIDVSSGGLSPAQKIPLGPGYQVGFAEAVKRASEMPTIAVGLITEPKQAETIVARGQADMVALARGILYDPRWPWHAAAELDATVTAPKQYLRSQPRELKRLFGTTGTEQR